MQVNFKKLSKDAKIPTKVNKGDAGYDLYSTEDVFITPLERKLFKTNIAMAIPDGYYGRIADRSGLALKSGLHVLAGVIDSTYRGDIGVVILNTNGLEDWSLIRQAEILKLHPLRPQAFIHIKKGERIAQIIFEKYEDVEFSEAENLEETDRGAAGFGSTGK